MKVNVASEKVLAKILAVMTISFSALYLPAIQACEQGEMFDFERPIMISKNMNSIASDTESYQFSVNNCEQLKNKKSKGQVGFDAPKEGSNVASNNLVKVKL
ncbi:MAG: hypothetical protein OEM38_08285 [Gammaproteobacteria bacterium]|nr:hypothetical protein [Gammaproteobacteria bacterium]